HAQGHGHAKGIPNPIPNYTPASERGAAVNIKPPPTSAINRSFFIISPPSDSTASKTESCRLYAFHNVWITRDTDSLPDRLIANIAQLQRIRSFVRSPTGECDHWSSG